MHETCWGVRVAVPRATAGVSREGLGKYRWLLSRVQVCETYRMTAGIIDELLVLLCAQTRGLCWCQAADWRTGAVAVRVSAWIVLRPWCRNRRSPTLSRAQACGLCCSHWVPVSSALRLLCAHTRGLCWCQTADWRTGTVAARVSAWIVLQPWCRNRRSPTLSRAQACGLCWSHWAPVPSALRLLCAQACGLCWCQAAGWRNWYGCRVRKRVDCA